MILLLVSLSILIFTIWKSYKLKKEHFLSLCNNKNYVELYPYNDDQSKWYAEYSDKKFNNILSNKKFSVLKKNNLKIDITNWINSIKELQKSKSKFYIVSFEKIKDIKYELIIHRKGKNHAIVFNLDMQDDPKNYHISNINVTGYKNEFEIVSNVNSFDSADDNSNYLRFNNLEDRWKRTELEQLTDIEKPF